MRHTFASQALSAGENVMWVAKQMGHRDWTITAKKIRAVDPVHGARCRQQAGIGLGENRLPVGPQRYAGPAHTRRSKGQALERLDTRGPEIGICNLCGLTARLTDDHVPPKGVPLVGRVYLDRLSEALGAQKPTKQARLFQRGVKYRSICAKCNNERLGQALDPTLVKFCKDAQAAITERLYLPSDIRVQQNKLFRSVIGHLLAHGLGTYKGGQFIERKTEYFLDLNQQFPEDLRLYYWVYPYKPQIVGRGLARKELIIDSDVVIFSLLKFFPIAWLCSIGDLEGPDAAQVTRVDHLVTPNIEDFADLRINPSYIPAAHWPEAPGDNSVVLHNRLGTIAIPRPPR